MDRADAQLPSEAPLRHRARHRYALCAAQREPDDCRERVYKSEITWLTTTADYVRLGIAMAKMETNTVLTAQEIYDVMRQFNVQFLSDKEIYSID